MSPHNSVPDPGWKITNGPNIHSGCCTLLPHVLSALDITSTLDDVNAKEVTFSLPGIKDNTSLKTFFQMFDDEKEMVMNLHFDDCRCSAVISRVFSEPRKTNAVDLRKQTVTDDLALGIEPRSSNHNISSGKTNDNEKTAAVNNEKTLNNKTQTPAKKSPCEQHKTAMVNRKNDENPPEGPNVVTLTKSKTNSKNTQLITPIISELPGDAS